MTEDLLDLILAVASGKEVKAERSDTDPIALFKTGVTL
ncbi:MAG: UxaA family hydrolase [Mollicutes bacterium]|nr:UxaA family hydrolase [Mollicutes bacterium]